MTVVAPSIFALVGAFVVAVGVVALVIWGIVAIARRGGR